MQLVTALKMPDSRTRSLAKALSWRITATFTTALIAYIVTGEMDTALVTGGIQIILHFLIYYGHESASP